MTKSSILTIIVVCILSGCTTTRDGVHFGVGGSPSTSDVEKLKQQAEKNLQSSTAKKIAVAKLTKEAHAGVILVGTVGPLRKVDDSSRHQSYQSYSQEAEKWHPNHATYMTEEEFSTQIGGWTTIETFGIPGVVNLRQPALVLNQHMNEIEFASTFGSMVAGTTADLVVAKNNEDGYMIIESVLCKDSSKEYKSCASQYERGRFDINTGEELDRELRPKSNGVLIDTTTYKSKKI